MGLPPWLFSFQLRLDNGWNARTQAEGDSAFQATRALARLRFLG